MKLRTAVRLKNGILGGIVGGIAGGLVMAVGMETAQRAGLLKTPLPLRIERKLEARLGLARKTGPKQEKALAMGEHMLISALMGAAFGAMSGGFNLPALPSGPLFGLGLYALNLGSIGPALDLTRGPWDESSMTVGRRMMMHVLYGTILALVAERIRRANI